MTIAPPLVFHTRMSMFHLDEINTVAQSFRADVYIEYRLRGITLDPDEGLVKTLVGPERVGGMLYLSSVHLHHNVVQAPWLLHHQCAFAHDGDHITTE